MNRSFSLMGAALLFFSIVNLACQGETTSGKCSIIGYRNASGTQESLSKWRAACQSGVGPSDGNLEPVSLDGTEQSSEPFPTSDSFAPSTLTGASTTSTTIAKSTTTTTTSTTTTTTTPTELFGSTFRLGDTCRSPMTDAFIDLDATWMVSEYDLDKFAPYSSIGVVVARTTSADDPSYGPGEISVDVLVICGDGLGTVSNLFSYGGDSAVVGDPQVLDVVWYFVVPYGYGWLKVATPVDAEAMLGAIQSTGQSAGPEQ